LGDQVNAAAAGGQAYRAGRWTAPTVAELAWHFPQLEILELLGQGGMGAVYKARQPGLDRLVALKILPPEAGDDPAFAERFSREARALARLNHPHIITVYDFGQADGLYHFIMEYVEGANLRQMLRTGNLQPADALKFVPQICDALQFAHDEGVVHRDIKPENILIDRRGRVKIADFGVAKLLGRQANEFTLTGPWQVMGTLHYMAPEQMDHPLIVDHRADLYALGVVLYEMLTGQLPLGRFAPPSQKAASDPRLDHVVMRALENEPGRRYQRASDLKSDLESIASTRPTPVTPAYATQPAGQDPGLIGRGSVPFEIPKILWGFARAHGLARIDERTLFLEFQTTFLGLVSLPAREERIPLDQIQSLHFKKGWWSAQVLIGAYRIATLSRVAGSRQGQLSLKINRRDRKLAQQFVETGSHLLGRATPAPAQPELPPAMSPMRQRIKSLLGEVRSLMFQSRVDTPHSEAPTIAPTSPPENRPPG
jgi:serine/threonine protein kinase